MKSISTWLWYQQSKVNVENTKLIEKIELLQELLTVRNIVRKSLMNFHNLKTSSVRSNSLVLEKIVLI